jgi:DNA excision repair protein ERCC-4
MVGSSKIGNDLREYLSKIPDGAPSGSEGRGKNMMEYRLRRYLRWKAAMSRKAKEGTPKKKKADEGPSEALKMKDKILQNRAANRRRLRGGAPAPASERGSTPSVAVTTNEKGKAIGGDGMLEERLYMEAGDFADL